MSLLVTTMGLGAVGLAGALAGELAEVVTYIRREHRMPFEAVKGWRGRVVKGELYPSLRTYAFAVAAKALVAFVLVSIEVWAKQISGPLGALTIGAAATPIMTRLAAGSGTGNALPAVEGKGQ
jgi:hypothetical protein